MNLSGIIFHIEEDAYEMLNKYLSTIKGYFKDSEGRDEIMSDIEARIAEMLQEKVNNTKQAVLKMDVENVIALMGKPEEFAGENAETPKNESSQDEERTSGGKKSRRVFRDPDDKILGGVCSGIASYFGFDPIWLRGAFAVSFFVFGSGLILYIILCIIIPKAKTAKIIRNILEIFCNNNNNNNIKSNKSNKTNNNIMKNVSESKVSVADQMQLCTDIILWCETERRTFLRQRVQARVHIYTENFIFIAIYKIYFIIL
jgi:phage shock protein PspC (stress-responsive transcriptional regulator)